MANATSYSDRLKEFIRNEEGLSSTVQGANKPITKNFDSVPDDLVLYTYKDQDGTAIGYGFNFVGGNQESHKVDNNPSMTMTKGEAERELTRALNEHAGLVRGFLKVDVTQSMFDALTSFSYNAGSGNVKSTYDLINQKRYYDAQQEIYRYPRIVSRRSKEAQMFMEDGLPDGIEDESTDERIPANMFEEVQFRETRSSEEISRSAVLRSGKNTGFVEARQIYPKYYNESDVSRFARGESVDITGQRVKDSRVRDSINGAGNTNWNQPPNPYAARYPYNHVTQTESGHLFELDDTPGAERINLQHESGTFLEIDLNGTQVNQIIGDGYQIFERDGYVYVNGSANIVIMGDANVRVNNDANVEVLGNMKTSVTGDYDLYARGRITMRAGQNLVMDSQQNVTVGAQGGNMALFSKGKMNVAGQELNLLSEQKINLSGGHGGLVEADTSFEKIKFVRSSGMQGHEFGQLPTVDRFSDMRASYESPEEGTPTDAFTARNKGRMMRKDKYRHEISEDSAEHIKNAPTSNGKNSSSYIEVPYEELQDSEITLSYRMSKNFNLGQVLGSGESGIPRGKNYGMTAEQIINNLRVLTVNVLEPIKAKYPQMSINSAWRSEKINRKYNGSRTSDHLTGCAADLHFKGASRRDYETIGRDIVEFLPAWKQIILETTSSGSCWLHVAFKIGENRGDVFSMHNHRTSVRGKLVAP